MLLVYFQLLYCKSQPKIFTLNIKLINLYSIISVLANDTIISFITSSIFTIFKLITLVVLMKYKNLVLKILGLATNSYIIIYNMENI